jgi:hypothetical protein
MLYALTVCDDLSYLPSGPSGPKAIAHNLSLEAAEPMELELKGSGDSTHETLGLEVVIFGYEERHADTRDPENCIHCKEICLEHSRRVLSLLEDEAARRRLS